MIATDSASSVRVHARVSLPAPSDPTYGYAGPTLASVDWTPSPSAAAAALPAGGNDDALFFGDDTVVDNPYGFLDDEGDFPEDFGDDDEDDVDGLAQTLVLRASRRRAAGMGDVAPARMADGAAACMADGAVRMGDGAATPARGDAPASLPGFRPPVEGPALAPYLPAVAEGEGSALASRPLAPWWTKPRYHWLLGACAFVLSGALWAAFAWYLSRS